MNALLTYFRERFPIPVVLLLSTAMAMLLIGVTTEFSLDLLRKTALVTGVFLMFLLRTRITDEFKDSVHDSENYPERPVQRGLVSRRQLGLLGATAFAIELLLVVALWGGSTNNLTLLSYLAVVIYSWLTANEFFVGDWLDRHFNVYLILHQLIFVFFGIWGASAALGNFGNRDILGIAGFVLMMVLVELARKYEVRQSPAGEIVKDTYLAVWGRLNTNLAIFGLNVLATAILYLQSAAEELWLGALLLTLGQILLRKRDSEVKGLIILNFFFQATVVFLR